MHSAIVVRFDKNIYWDPNWEKVWRIHPDTCYPFLSGYVLKRSGTNITIKKSKCAIKLAKVQVSLIFFFVCTRQDKSLLNPKLNKGYSCLHQCASLERREEPCILLLFLLFTKTPDTLDFHDWFFFCISLKKED